MTDQKWTPSQAQRITELGGALDKDALFSSEEERETKFSELVSGLQKSNRSLIRAATEHGQRHPLGALENDLASALVKNGFLEVKSPMIISKNSLEKMGITDSHPLSKQVFWLDSKTCLRPMLAPNLYFVMRHLKRNVKTPLLFEIGPCFRKESKGTEHLEEFTMLNLVELAPEGDPETRLREHIDLVMKTVGLDYELKTCPSEVYINTLDVEINGLEVASGAVGPHPLDKAHGIVDSWAGVGFGLERLLWIKNGGENIRKIGRSLIYVNGARIDI